MKAKKWFLILAFIAIIGLIIAYILYGKIFADNTSFEEDKKIVFVHESATLTEWLGLPENQSIFKHPDILENTALLKDFEILKPGRYAIKKGMNSNTIINLLRSGNQEPVRIRTDNIKTLDALAGKLGASMQNDSLDFIKAFRNKSNYPSKDYNSTTIACIFRPNTYDFLWTITPEQFLERMSDYNNKLWTEERLNKSKKIGLSPLETIILASIVKAETTKNIEAPKIAGLYLNRLRIDMPLQSDPTAVFGAGIDHVQRVTNEISQVSAYNTYQNKGLPPGPINFPEEVYIDAVLNPEKHDYLYMCAQAGGSGTHNFAKTFEQHRIYASQYRKWLDQQGIR